LICSGRAVIQLNITFGNMSSSCFRISTNT
jgi:hypothetical protein